MAQYHLHTKLYGSKKELKKTATSILHTPDSQCSDDREEEEEEEEQQQQQQQQQQKEQESYCNVALLQISTSQCNAMRYDANNYTIL